ncbi:hypothetical protein FIBSPDRAFT_297373 [Athelia psychrophila]|uniref:Uncharacterized protein n=1 Tax=Athelia psychrophila TaxID=1759441 RepID=A0A167X7U1_9AGAM|nr:hypothetical protein FIBSPDRAFT_297373 [Fibularhizoctonia sp. CBS 109695]
MQSIGTLDHSRLLPSDCLKISGVRRPTISTANSSFTLPYHAEPNCKRLAFPADSRGFLYLSNAEEPQSAWQMRFRVTNSDSPEGFDSGTDLLLPNQEPWIMALKTLGRKQLAAVWEVLVKDTSLSDALPTFRPRALKQSIQTLVSARLRPSDYLDLAGTIHPHISTQDSRFQLLYAATRGERIPFPPSARGFLYLHAPVEEPKVTWQIRFRVTEHDSPTSFESGSDLLYPNQIPWFIPLVVLKSDRGPLFTLRELLVRDGLDVDRLAERSTYRNGSLSKPLIHSLGQLFHVDFQRYKLDVAFVGFGADSKIERTTGSPLSTKVSSDGNSIRHRPYAGSALCCFEAHSSPDSTYPDTLALRIKKITTPVTIIEPEIAYRIPMPQEGELVMRYTRGGPGSLAKTLVPRPWTLDAPTTAHPVVQAILHGKTVR